MKSYPSRLMGSIFKIIWKTAQCILNGENRFLGPPRIEPMIGRVGFPIFPRWDLVGHYGKKSAAPWPKRFGPDINILYIYMLYISPRSVYMYRYPPEASICIDMSKGLLADSKQSRELRFFKIWKYFTPWHRTHDKLYVNNSIFP